MTCMQSFSKKSKFTRLNSWIRVEEFCIHPAYSSSQHNSQHCRLCLEWTQQNLCGTRRTVTLSRSWAHSTQLIDRPRHVHCTVLYISAVICCVSALWLIESVGGGSGQSTLPWNCSFEQSDNRLCGMTQEQTSDKFDWTVHNGSTPSYGTGPDSAHHGSFYAYIEASDPRRPNDQAWWASFNSRL